MEPIQKALYLLFLNHPEGLVFKRLSEHREEFISLYDRISRRSDKEANEQTALRLLDPTNNSINEKCSRIKAAFLSRFDDSIAKHYYITSNRMTIDPATGFYSKSIDSITGLYLKKIDLERSLVFFQRE